MSNRILGIRTNLWPSQKYEQHTQTHHLHLRLYMHHELTLCQEITYTIGHGDSSTTHMFHGLSKFHCSFLCGSSLHLLATVNNSCYMTQFELDMRKWEWQEPKILDAESDILSEVYVRSHICVCRCHTLSF